MALGKTGQVSGASGPDGTEPAGRWKLSDEAVGQV